MPAKLSSLLQSRRFLFALAGVLSVVVNHLGFTDLSEADMQHVVLVIGTWIVGDSITKTD